MPVSRHEQWIQDVLRAKLVSLRLPTRLLLQYKEHVLEQIRYWENEMHKLSIGKQNG